MTHKPLLNILIVVGLLALPLALGRGPAAQAAPEADILYVQPGATGDCTSWEDACELQTALSLATPGSGDEIWVAQGVYKPINGIPYESCQAIREADPTAPDGDYLIQNGGNAFQVYCDDMAGTPEEYLTLDSSVNYSQYTAGGASPGTDVRSNYSMVRLLPDTLQIDISDQTFASSSGSLQLGDTVVTSMPYGVAMDCKLPPSQTGVAHIDLRGTPFAIHPEDDPADTFVLGGYYPDGSATYTDNDQVVSLQGGGYCGWIQPGPDVIPDLFNDAGGPVLELEHILPERRATFQLKSGVALYGGFPSEGGIWEDRDWQTHPTVLSGDIDDNDVTDIIGVVTDTVNIQGANAYHVVTGSGVNATAILDGFTITAGNANGAVPQNWGGGMYNTGSSPTLTDVTFSGNNAGFGGGMYNIASSPTLTNATFSGNSVTLGQGGGMYTWMGNPTLTNATFSGNSATLGIGGGMFNVEDSPKLTNAIFSGNSAQSGGGMFNQDCNPMLTNVTFSGNSAEYYGSGLYNWTSNPTLTNAILWGNPTPTGSQIMNDSSMPVISYSDIQGSGGSGTSWDTALGSDGGGNIDDDPQFVDAAGGNLRLRPFSPAVDAGDNGAVPLGVVTDLDGKPRFVDIPGVPDMGNGLPPIVDMGAYEAQNVLYLPLVKR